MNFRRFYKGHLYVVEAGEFCKIGITNEVYKRLKAIYTHCPIEVGRVWVSEEMPDVNVKEYEMHNFFESKRVRPKNEWFKMGFINTVDEMEKRFNGVVYDNVLHLKPDRKKKANI